MGMMTMVEKTQKDDMILVDVAQVIAARGAIKAAKRLGKDPDPLMVKIANASDTTRENTSAKTVA